MVWTSLVSWLQYFLSGLLGAIVGGWIAGRGSYKGGIEGARIAIAHAEELFDKERKLREAERQERVVDTLRAELACHLLMINKSSYGLKKRGLAPGFWRRMRVTTGFMGKDFNEKLLELYQALTEYREAFDAIPFGGGAKEHAEKHLSEARESLNELADLLDAKQA
jgi:hypothetical protein